MPQNVKDIVFTMGITDFDVTRGCRMQGSVHAYIQTKMDRWAIGEEIAEAALDAWELSQSRALSDFDGSRYGSEYLNFRKNEKVEILPPPADVAPEKWAYGRHNGKLGWFPPTYVSPPLA